MQQTILCHIRSISLLNSSRLFTPPLFPPLTPGVSPACDPAVVSRVEAGLLARQAGVADEVWRVDVCGSLHQGDVVVQLAVSRVSEVLVSVDPLHRENPLCRLWALQLVLPQDDPPAPSILCFTPERRRRVRPLYLSLCYSCYFCDEFLTFGNNELQLGPSSCG